MKEKLKFIKLFTKYAVARIKENLDDKLVTTVLVTIAGFFIAFAVFNALSNLIHHQSPVANILGATIWYWIANTWIVGYQKKRAERQVEELEYGISHLMELIVMIRDANKHGISIQDLEKKGIIKLEIVPFPPLAGTPPISPFEKETLDELIKKRQKKKKLPN